MQTVKRKIALQLLVTNLSLVVNFALAVVLARLLSPDDIGVFSMSAVLIAVAHTLRDFGVTAYLKREKELTNQTIRTARGLLYLTSWSMATAMFLSAGLWARFFNEPRVEAVVHVLALGFIFIPFGSIAQAVMTRDLNVVQSAKVTAVSTLVYFVASVALALMGFQHMTMAWANLVNILVSGLAYNLLLGRRLPWMPSLHGWRSMVSFGTANMLTALCKVVNTSIPDLLLGRLSVAADVGLFSRANSAVNMVGKVVEPSIAYFTLPYMARLHHETGHVNAQYQRAVSLLNSALLPVLAWVALVPQDIVLLLFGDQWLGAAPAIPWLCAATAIATWFSLSTQTLTSVGRPFAAVFPLTVLIAGKLLAITLMYDGSLESFAIAILVGEALSIPAYLYLESRLLGVAPLAWAIDVSKTLLVVVASGAAMWPLIHSGMDGMAIPIRLALSLPLMVGLCLAGYVLLRLPIAEEMRDFFSKLMISRN